MDIITKVQELIEELNGKMILLNLKKKNKMEIKIQIPDNCELVKDENTYIVKEKKLSPPRSWDEFCEKFPVQIGEAFIESSSLIHTWDHEDARKRVDSIDRNLCSSREEAEAFLTLMQLRQLRKAWVGSWEQPDHNTIISAITYYISDGRVIIMTGNFWNSLALSFPTRKMAVDFFECFRGLCETAKTLL